jgi:nickel-dependent lactate racemase
MISHPNATWGCNEGNPVWEEMRECALMLPNTFLLNVTMNEAREITGVFAGDIILAHQQGTAFIRKNAMVAVKKPYDIVITTNSGYPLDQNLYQAIKGVSAASRVVRDGGAVIMAAACADGLPDDSGYANLLSAFNSPSEVLQKILTPGFSEPDQWTVQIQAQIQLRADVFIYSDGLSKNKIRQALLLPVGDIEKELEYLKTRYGNRICVIPEGPQTIAYLEHS